MSISPRSLSSLVVWLRSPSNLDSRDESFKHSTDNLDQWSRIYFIMYIQKWYRRNNQAHISDIHSFIHKLHTVYYQINIFFLKCTTNHKESACNAGDPGSIPGLGRSLEKGKATPPVFLSGEFHGQRSLVGYSLCSHQESDTIERLAHTHTNIRALTANIVRASWGNGNPLQHSCLENPMDGGSW